RMQRLVDLADDERGEIRRIGLEPHAAREGQQDLAGVVLLTEETLVEPAASRIPILEGRDGGGEEREVEPRAAGGDLGDGLGAVARQGDDQRDGRNTAEDGQRPARERVLQAAAEDQPRPEYSLH